MWLPRPLYGFGQGIHSVDDGGAWDVCHALRRAEQSLQALEATEAPTREALRRRQQLAEQTARYARLAQNQARWQQKRLKSEPRRNRLTSQDREATPAEG